MAFGLHLMAHLHHGDRDGGASRNSRTLSAYVSHGEMGSMLKHAHMCAIEPFNSIGVGGISTGDFKMLLIRSPEGRCSRLLPIPLQQIALDQFNAFTALREETGRQEHSEPKTETRDATDSGEQRAGSIDALGQEPSCFLLLIDTGLNTIE